MKKLILFVRTSILVLTVHSFSSVHASSSFDSEWETNNGTPYAHPVDEDSSIKGSQGKLDEDDDTQFYLKGNETDEEKRKILQEAQELRVEYWAPLQKLKEMKAEKKELHRKLEEANRELEEANRELEEANRVKKSLNRIEKTMKARETAMEALQLTLERLVVGLMNELEVDKTLN